MRTRPLALAALSLLAAGCGGSSGGGTPLGPADMATPSDKQLCDDACAKLIGCGVEYDSTCSSNCKQNAPVFLACIRSMPADCNGLALCSFKQYQAVVCAAGGGYPAGVTSCRQTAMCEGACNVNSPTAACICGCISTLDPQKALYSLINAQCAQARCPSCRITSFNGADCNTCAVMMCGTNPCLSN